MPIIQHLEMVNAIKSKLKQYNEILHCIVFFKCAAHGIHLVGESPTTGITAKYSEPQVINSDVMGERSSVTKSSRLRIEI